MRSPSLRRPDATKIGSDGAVAATENSDVGRREVDRHPVLRPKAQVVAGSTIAEQRSKGLRQSDAILRGRRRRAEHAKERPRWERAGLQSIRVEVFLVQKVRRIERKLDVPLVPSQLRVDQIDRRQMEGVPLNRLRLQWRGPLAPDVGI